MSNGTPQLINVNYQGGVYESRWVDGAFFVLWVPMIFEATFAGSISPGAMGVHQYYHKPTAILALGSMSVLPRHPTGTPWEWIPGADGFTTDEYLPYPHWPWYGDRVLEELGLRWTGNSAQWGDTPFLIVPTDPDGVAVPDFLPANLSMQFKIDLEYNAVKIAAIYWSARLHINADGTSVDGDASIDDIDYDAWYPMPPDQHLNPP